MFFLMKICQFSKPYRVIQLSSVPSNVTKAGMSNTLFNENYFSSYTYVQTTYKYNKSIIRG